MGDPAGVGLEIAVKARAAADTAAFFLVADIDAVRRAAARAGAGVSAIALDDPAQALAAWERGLPVLHAPLAIAETPGAPTPDNAPAIIDAIAQAVALARAGRVGALVTLPIAKSVLYAAGFRHPGHTEFVADLVRDCPWPGPRGPVMMLAGEHLRVALATIHAPLAAVAAALSRETVEHTARVVLDALTRDFAIARPRLALAGLNPHAGEAGAIGREEIDIINPAAAALRAEGFDVTDSRPADTLFHAEARARYDAVIAMYHDQGLIPIKTLDFWGAANITLGLPVVRTSPDHGAGFDIAGRNLANPESFRSALRFANAIAARRAAQ